MFGAVYGPCDPPKPHGDRRLIHAMGCRSGPPGRDCGARRGEVDERSVAEGFGCAAAATKTVTEMSVGGASGA